MNELAIAYAEELVAQLARFAFVKEPAAPDFVQEAVMLGRSKEQLEKQIASDAESVILQLFEVAKLRGYVLTEKPGFSLNTASYVARKDGYAVGLRGGYLVDIEDENVFCFTVIFQKARSDV